MPGIDTADAGLIADQPVSECWLSLLGRLTESSRHAVVWKNAEGTLRGVGDLDVLAPAEDWDAIVEEFQRWSDEQRLEIVRVSRDQSMRLLAIEPGRSQRFELHVKEWIRFRRARLWHPVQLASLVQWDERGFRRLRAGAEGLLKLVLKATSRSGARRPAQIGKEGIAALMQQDWAGVRETARFFGAAERPVLASARSFISGGWNRPASLCVQGWTVLKALAQYAGVGANARLSPRQRIAYASSGNRPDSRPAGGVLVVAGPDGVGKTTLCHGLKQVLPRGSPVLRIHHRNGIQILPGRRMRGPSTEPHRHAPYPPMLSLAKALFLFADLWLGWRLKLWPFVRRGGWAIVERNWWDVIVDPRRYRLRPIPRLGPFLAGLLPPPHPDLVLVLEGPPDLIRNRKAQLPEAELVRQMKAWRSLLLPSDRCVYLDISNSPDEVLRRATAEVHRVIGGPVAAP